MAGYILENKSASFRLYYFVNLFNNFIAILTKRFREILVGILRLFTFFKIFSQRNKVFKRSGIQNTFANGNLRVIVSISEFKVTVKSSENV
ncbi:hypothetical protein MMC2321_02860 [Chitinophaga sp. MM2321]